MTNQENPLSPTDGNQVAGQTGRNGSGTLSDRVRSLRLSERSSAGRGGKLPWVLCVLLLGSTLAFGFQAFRRPSDAAKGKPAAEAAAVSGPRAGSGDVVLQAKGYIIPAHQIQVSPQVGGRIENLYITEGMRVEKGQILAQLEVIEYETDWKRAVAKHEAAVQTSQLAERSLPSEEKRAEHEQAEAQADLLDIAARYERAQRLPPGSVSVEEMLRMRAQKDMAQARFKRSEQGSRLAQMGKWRVAATKAEAAAAKADLEKALWRLENCTVHAPVSGTILTKKAEEGNLVNPAAYSNGLSASLCDLADLSDLEVDLSIQERDIAVIHVGQGCTIMPEAFQADKRFLARHPNGYAGEVSRLMPIADRAKGAIPVRVKVRVPRDEEGVYLKPDMGVIVSFKKVTEDEPSIQDTEKKHRGEK
jgi:HlyD family secretion protein